MIEVPNRTDDRYKNILRIVEEAVALGVPLSLHLKSRGLTYDDLVYAESAEVTTSQAAPPSLDEFELEAHGVPVVSFFTGAGGMDLGFETAGYTHLAAFEINELFCKTLRRNRPEWKVFGPPTHDGDVSKFGSVAAALTNLISKPFDGVFIGGPPCQPFSVAANQRFTKSGDNYKRTGFADAELGNLLFDYVNLIVEFSPAAFVIENVPGLRDLDDGEQLSIAVDTLTQAGYSVADPKVLEASDYGVPQQRQRLFVVGSRLDREFIWPKPRSDKYGAGSVLFREIGKDVKNHETREHMAVSILRYMKLGYGERDQLGRVDRLNPALPSKTVIAGGSNGGGRSHLHPEIPRTLSVRESARLQTFPDSYVFVGSTARQFTQVGNAVPPVLAAQLAAALYISYFEARKTTPV